MGACPKCGAPVGDTDFACRQCGMSFVADPSVARLSPEQVYAPPPPPPRMVSPFVQPPEPFAFNLPNPNAPYDPYVPAPGTADASSEASTALMFALLGLFCFGFFFGWIAVRRARNALMVLQRAPSTASHTKATAALYLGYLDIALWILFIWLRLTGRR